MADNTISPVVPNVSGGRTVSTGQKAVTQTSAQSGIDFKSYLGGRTAVQDNSTTFLKRRNSYTLNKNKTKEISIKTASKNSPTESEVKKITDDISSQIVEKVTDDLDISEDELNNAMQLLGLTAMDLLNPANLSALYCEVTGNASDPQALVLNADFTALFNDVSQVASENDAQLVRLVAGRLSMYLGHNVEYDDLVSYGIFGLIDAIDKFNLEKNVKFETYASLRIRGAILDQIRKMDWIPRTVRQRQRKIDEAIKNIELRTGKTANDADLAKELSISEDELCNWQSQLKVTNVVSLDEFDESGPEPVMDAAHNSHYAQPEEIVTQEELKTMLVKSLDNLTEKERRVIELYYYEDLTLKEISNILEVSESRVSQLHTKGLIKMRKVMGPYMNILTNA